MDRAAAFLQDICAHPDDVSPRLIYADWLDEHGGPDGAARAEFIRVQCELAVTEEYTPRWRQLSARETALLKKHKAEWVAPFRGRVIYARLYRGFVEEVTMHGRRFLRDGEELFRLGPLRRVKFAALDGGLRPLPLPQFFACPLLARLRELDLHGTRLGDDGARMLAGSPYLSGLTWLGLDETRIEREGLVALGASPHLTGVRELSLAMRPYATDRGDDRARAVADGSAWDNLTGLNLHAHNVGDAGLRALVDSPFMPGLRTLDLGRNSRLTGRGIDYLAGSGRVKELRTLSLSYCNNVRDSAVEALAGSRSLAGLTALDLTHPDAERRRFGRGPDSPGLTDAGVRVLASSGLRLRCLVLRRQPVTDAGAEAILNSESLRGLGRLDLRETLVSRAVQQALRKHFGPGVCQFSLAR
jgi:uncharacterized protein (TIGR02996 family)